MSSIKISKLIHNNEEEVSYLLELIKSAISAINQATNITTLNNVRNEYLGKKGRLTFKMSSLSNLPIKKRRILGSLINEGKNKIIRTLNTRKIELEEADINIRLAQKTIDISLPGRRIENGRLHPITLTIDCIEFFFSRIGFIVVTGPEIEDSYHNFDALNIPKHHSVRTNHDTFWIDAGRLLRTQTSSIQIRIMKKYIPPIRIISSGKVYRNDCDQNHTPMFHQMEGLIVDENISFANLKGTIKNFLNDFFERNIQIRFRPSYFPFTEPSAEVDIMGENGKWLEVLGCGIVHPNVLRNVNIDPEIYSGFAFGMGIERLAMLRYGITDLRIFFENDLRFLKQFK